jgi:hypothetical protein
MARSLRWKELLIGILAAFAVVGGALSILIFGSIGRLHGKVSTVYVTTNAARGVIGGTEVWLDGQKVGLVRTVTFRPATVPPKERLVITMAVLDNARLNLRMDSRVQIQAGGNLIGDQVIYLSSGTFSSRGVVDGDTIRGGEQDDVEEVTSEMSLATREFPGIIENVKLLAAQLQTAEGTLGALGIEKGGTQMTEVRARSARLMARALGSGSHGTVAMAMGGNGVLQARAKTAMAQVDSVKALVMSNKHSLGRFQRDSTLVIEMGRIREELAEVQRLAESPTGTVGRIRTDSVIVRNVHRNLVSMDSLFADLKKHPFRYIVF